MPAYLRAPEIVLGDRLGIGVDIWSFGCLVFELLTSHPLFFVENLSGERFDETTNDEHLIQITGTIQPLPTSFFNRWPRAHMYFRPNGERLDNDDLECSSDVEPAGELLGPEDALSELDESGISNPGIDIDSQSQVSLASFRRFDSIKTRFRAVKPADIDERGEEEVIGLMRLALQPDPAKRASAAQLLQQPWFQQ